MSSTGSIGAIADAAARAVASMFLVLGVGVAFALAGKLDKDGLKAIGVTINWYVQNILPPTHELTNITGYLSLQSCLIVSAKASPFKPSSLYGFCPSSASPPHR